MRRSSEKDNPKRSSANVTKVPLWSELTRTQLLTIIRIHGHRVVAVAGTTPAVYERWRHAKGFPTMAQQRRIVDAFGRCGEIEPPEEAGAPRQFATDFITDINTRYKKGESVLKLPSLASALAHLPSGHTVNPETGEMLNASQRKIATACDAIKALLLEKNAKYGDSALNPRRIFSRATATEQILVRIDDKLSRMQTTGWSASDEDTLQDLIGYLILLKVALGNTGEKS